MIKLVVFDLDGTLLDTIGDLRLRMNTMLKRYGFKAVSLEKVRQGIGAGALEFVQNCLPEEYKNDTKYYDSYARILNSSAPKKTRVFCGIKSQIKKLHKMGIKTAVLSNKLQTGAENAIDTYFEEGTFFAVCGESPQTKVKPDPAGLLRLMEQADALPAQTVMIGDCEPDILVAENAGAKHIAALWGYRTKDELLKVGASCFLKNPKGICKLIKNM